MKIDNVRCIKCGGNDFQNYCTTCKDLEAHDDAIRRKCAEAAVKHLDKHPYAYSSSLITAIMNAGKESEESNDERLATKQQLGAGCHNQCGDMLEEGL